MWAESAAGRTPESHPLETPLSATPAPAADGLILGPHTSHTRPHHPLRNQGGWGWVTPGGWKDLGLQPGGCGSLALGGLHRRVRPGRIPAMTEPLPAVASRAFFELLSPRGRLLAGPGHAGPHAPHAARGSHARHTADARGGAWVRRTLPPMRHSYLRFTRSAGQILDLPGWHSSKPSARGARSAGISYARAAGGLVCRGCARWGVPRAGPPLRPTST